ncbi:MAG: tripartite tricarboxylate transporter TctB family protein [Betaproteobacteria bacterium]
MTRTTITRCIGLGIIGVCIALFAITFGFQTTPIGGSYYGPAFFPRLLVVFIALLALILVVTGREDEPSGSGKARAANDGARDIQEEPAQGIAAGRLVLRILGLTLAYLLVMRPVGYFLSTVAYTFVSVWMLRPKDHLHAIWILVGSIAFTFALQYLFGSVMNVMLPPGLLRW